MSDLPILYSFRRCPYAIRARMAMHAAGISHELREVILADKPEAMLEASRKGTVPVLIVDGVTLDESLEVMAWAFNKNDVLGLDASLLSHPLILRNDDEFKPVLDRYKYFDRHPEQPRDVYLQQAMPFLSDLEARLRDHSAGFVCGHEPTAVDVAIFPFIRQFAFADSARFQDLPLPRLHNWLSEWLASDLFKQVMTKHSPWRPSQPPTVIEPQPVVQHFPAQQSWVIRFGEGGQVREEAYMRYRYESDDTVDFYTTLVPPGLRGGGVAARLVDAGLAWAERNDLQIKTSCWYAEKRRQQQG